MPGVYSQYSYNIKPGPWYLGAESLPDTTVAQMPVRLIAYYLPQFHAIPENDEWWGVGFTEWTNVTKSLPRYVGHRQPNLPADLGFYDLTSINILRRQSELARRAGIFGFCFHHYWFSGHQLLQAPLENLLNATDIDIAFCLNWANESWSRRWDGRDKDVLILQKYANGDEIRFAQSILRATRDPRYIKIDGRPLIMIYRPNAIPDAKKWFSAWREFFRSEGMPNPYLVMAQAHDDRDPKRYDLDAAAGFPPHLGWNLKNVRDLIDRLDVEFDGRVISYIDLKEHILSNVPEEFLLFPGVCPRWDNEARKPGHGTSFFGATPAEYGDWLGRACAQALGHKNQEERIVFINAWNEWAEGAHLEPDRHFGYAFLVETRRVIERLTGPGTPAEHRSVSFESTSPYEAVTFSRRAKLKNRISSKLGNWRKPVF